MKLHLPLLFSTALAHAGGIYWTNRGAGLLERSLYDGKGRATVLSSAGANVRGLWLDLPNSRIYYCDNGADVLRRLNLDGTGATTIIALGQDSAFPADIELNPAAGHLYFCDQQTGRLRRYNLDGTPAGGVTILTDTTYQPYYLDLDLVNGKIYWGDFDGVSANTGNVFRMNLDGTGRTTVVTGNLETRGVCVDVAGGMLYWVNRNFAGIMRCKLSDLPPPGGTPPVNATDATKAQMLYSGLDTPHGMVLDVPAGKVYWVDTGTNAGVGLGSQAISRGDMDGSGPHEVLVNLGSEPWDIDVDPRVLTYSEWVARFFVRNPGAIAEAGADPDGDGILNVIECAMGLHPRKPDVHRLPDIITHSEAGQTFPAIRYTRRTGVAGLTVLPQQSFDMSFWWDENSPTDEIPRLTQVSATPLPENMELVTVRSIYSLQQQPRQYLRVWAQVAP